MATFVICSHCDEEKLEHDRIEEMLEAGVDSPYVCDRCLWLYFDNRQENEVLAYRAARKGI